MKTSTENSRLSLYDIGAEGLVIELILAENEGELTPELETRLDEVMRQGPERIEGAAMILRQLEASAEACKKEAQRLAERAKSFDKQADSLKNRMVFAVDAAFNGKVKTQRFTIWTQKSRDTVSVGLAEEFTIDMLREDSPDLVKTEYSIDKAATDRLWETHSSAYKSARAILANPEASDAEKVWATETVKLIPDALSFEEKTGARYLRVK